MKLSKFTTAVIAGAIAITTFTTAPVAAASDGDRLAQILLGAAAIGVIVHSANKRKRARQEVTHYDKYQPRVVHNRHRPKTCLRKKYTHGGWKTFYSRKCLEQHRSRSRNHNNHNVYNNNSNHNTHNNNGHQNSRHYKKHHKNTHRNQATYNQPYKWHESEK